MSDRDHPGAHGEESTEEVDGMEETHHPPTDDRTLLNAIMVFSKMIGKTKREKETKNDFLLLCKTTSQFMYRVERPWNTGSWYFIVGMQGLCDKQTPYVRGSIRTRSLKISA